MNLDYVVDANVVISILISGKTKHLNYLRFFRFCTIDYLFDKISKYQTVILRKSKQDETFRNQFVKQVFQEITVLPSFMLSEKSRKEAFELTKKIDEKDTTYVALSLELNLMLLTRDKILANGLRKQGYKQVQLLEEFLDTI